MSLINDALKRARQAQQKQPASLVPGTSLRPVDGARTKSFGRGLLFGIVVVVLVAIAVGVWLIANYRDAKPVPVTGTKQEATSTPLAQAPAPKPAQTSTQPASKPIEPPQASVPVVTSASPAQPASNATPVAKPSAPTSTAAVEATVARQTIAWPKLQGILYRPDHPSALLNNKAVSIGEHSGEFLVVAIDRQSVTLARAGQTNVLRLAQ